VIQSFWHGADISVLERLSMSSFLSFGHPFHLYTYDEVKGVPLGVEQRDAGSIIPRTSLFTNLKGSVGIFADWFRQELLFDRGGFWVDLDVVCLRPFVFAENDVYGLESRGTVSNAVIRLSRGHGLARELADRVRFPNRLHRYDGLRLSAKKLARRFFLGNDIRRQGWGESAGPRGLTKALHRRGMLASAQPVDAFFPIAHQAWKSIYHSDGAAATSAIRDSHAVHLWNEMARREAGFDKNATYPPRSLIELLKARFL